jgi:hypothetical protein
LFYVDTSFTTEDQQESTQFIDRLPKIVPPLITMVDTFDGNPEAKSAPAVSPGGIQAGGDCCMQ